ncbi:hypothetical protein V1527DRAFT_451364 [Lipomyces starkeyi]
MSSTTQADNSWKTLIDDFPPLSVSDKFHDCDVLKRTLASWTRNLYADLWIPMKGKGKTPTPSSRSTATRKQVDFKQKLLERDGSISVLGEVMDATGTTPDTPSNPAGTEILIAAHIIPFCANNRPRLRAL